MVLKLQYFRQVAGNTCSGIPPYNQSAKSINTWLLTVNLSLFSKTSVLNLLKSYSS